MSMNPATEPVRRLRWPPLWILGLLLLALLSAGAVLAYLVSREARCLHFSEATAQTSNRRERLLWIQRTLQHNPRNLRALELMVEYHAPVDIAEAMRWNRILMDADPERAEPKLRRIEFLRDLGLPAQARQELAALPDVARSLPLYEKIKADLSSGLFPSLAGSTPPESPFPLSLWLLDRLPELQPEGVLREIEKIPAPVRSHAAIQVVQLVMETASTLPLDYAAQTKLSAQFSALSTPLLDFPALPLRLADWLEARHWTGTAEAILWFMTDSSQPSADALERLEQRYAASRESRGLWRIAKLQAGRQPLDLDVQKRYVYLCCLLELDLQKILPLAEQLARSKVTPHQLTAAYALQTKGRTKEALALLDSLPRAEWENPPELLGTATVLKAAGRTEDAKRLIQNLSTEDFLPEERVLWIRLVSEGR